MPATNGSEPACIQKQKRRAGSHECGRYSQGNNGSTEDMRDPNKVTGPRVGQHTYAQMERRHLQRGYG